jgi:hypothetical protein
MARLKQDSLQSLFALPFVHNERNHPMKFVAFYCLIFISLILSASLTICAQDAETKQQIQELREKSNLEKFSTRSGALLEKQFIYLGRLPGVDVKVLQITDLLTKASISGVRIEQFVSRSHGSGTNIAFLDQDEVDVAIRAIKHIQQNVMTSQRSSYTEVGYSSRGGFQIGCYYSGGTWQPYVQVDRYDRDSMFLFSIRDLSDLLAFLEGAKLKL